MSEYRKGELKRPIEIVKQQAFDELSALKVSLEVPPVFQEALPPVTTLPGDVLSEAIANSQMALSLVSRSPSLEEYVTRTKQFIEFTPEKKWLERCGEFLFPGAPNRRFAIGIFKPSIVKIDEVIEGEPSLFFLEDYTNRRMPDSDLQSWWDRGSGIKEITYLASLNREKILTHLLKAVS